MPIYDFVCHECQRREVFFKPISELEELEKSLFCCNQQMAYDWTPAFLKPPFKAFVTANITGRPIEITSLGQLRQLERQHKVNMPAFGDSMMGSNHGYKETTWESPDGKTHQL